MKCYHSTTGDRLVGILQKGLLPNSEPTWFDSPTPYVMLSREPWPDLNGSRTVVLEVTDSRIQEEYFNESEGLRWPYRVAPQHLKEAQK